VIAPLSLTEEFYGVFVVASSVQLPILLVVCLLEYQHGASRLFCCSENGLKVKARRSLQQNRRRYFTRALIQ